MFDDASKGGKNSIMMVIHQKPKVINKIIK
jgi:hypothetical protein